MLYKISFLAISFCLAFNIHGADNQITNTQLTSGALAAGAGIATYSGLHILGNISINSHHDLNLFNTFNMQHPRAYKIVCATLAACLASDFYKFIYNSTAEGCITKAKKILYDMDHPLLHIASFSHNQQEFLEKLDFNYFPAALNRLTAFESLQKTAFNLEQLLILLLNAEQRNPSENQKIEIDDLKAKFNHHYPHIANAILAIKSDAGWPLIALQKNKIDFETKKFEQTVKILCLAAVGGILMSSTRTFKDLCNGIMSLLITGYLCDKLGNPLSLIVK